MRSPDSPPPTGLVADLWRFPVKSLAGERLRRAFLGPFGLIGDRRHAVIADGVPLSARRAHGLLAYRARYGDREAAEEALVDTPDGRTLRWDDPVLARDLAERLGWPVLLDRAPVGFHDAAPVHIVTEASLAALGAWTDEEVDRRRFRPNIVVELEQPRPFAEAGWPGVRLAIGATAVIEVLVSTERCAVTTFDPDTLERDPRILAALARERENFFGVYGSVLRTGSIAAGDAVRVLAAAPEIVDRVRASAKMDTLPRGGAVW